VEFFESVPVVGFIGPFLNEPQQLHRHRKVFKGATKRRADNLEQLGVVLTKPNDYLDLLGRKARSDRDAADRV
jgi:hypothetical protein